MLCAITPIYTVTDTNSHTHTHSVEPCRTYPRFWCPRERPNCGPSVGWTAGKICCVWIVWNFATTALKDLFLWFGAIINISLLGVTFSFIAPTILHARESRRPRVGLFLETNWQLHFAVSQPILSLFFFGQLRWLDFFGTCLGRCFCRERLMWPGNQGLGLRKVSGHHLWSSIAQRMFGQYGLSLVDCAGVIRQYYIYLYIISNI